MSLKSLFSIGEDAVDHQAFKLHAAEDEGVYWLEDRQLVQLIFQLPMEVIYQSWMDTDAVSEISGPFRTIFGYTRSKELNGACSIERGVHCISLTKGLVFHLLRICTFAACQESAFTDFPKDGAENLQGVTTGELLKMDDETFNRLFLGFIYPDVLVAPFRIRLALLLLFDALHIAWSHELSHVYRGHMGYLCEGRGRLRMNENEALPHAQTELSLYRALEFDADHYAIRLVTDLAFQRLDPMHKKLVPELSLDQRLSLLLMAGCFLTLGWTTFARERGESLFHPPPYVRYYTLILGFSDISESHVDKTHIRYLQATAFKQFGVLAQTDKFFLPLAVFGTDHGAKKIADRQSIELQEILIANDKRLKPYQFLQQNG